MHGNILLMEGNDQLFVYGTLLSGIENQYARYLQMHSKYVGKGYFFGQLYDVGHYPGAIYDPECNEKVFGDIILLKNKEEALKVLDVYEGVGEPHLLPHEYSREIVIVMYENQPVPCWTYLYNHPVNHLKKISSGSYLQYLNKR